MTVYIFRYSQLIDTDRMRTIRAFAEKSGLSTKDIVDIALAEEKEEGIISQYKSGSIDTVEFRAKLNELIENKGGTQLADNVFDDCWNAMCRVDSIKLQKLYNLQSEHKNCKIHVIGDTNDLQHKYISKQIALLPETEKPEITYTLSFEKQTSNREKLEELAKNVYSDLDIIVWHCKNSENDGVELLHNYAKDNSSLVQQDIIDKVVEDSTNESNKSHDPVEDTIAVMGGLELSSNSDSVE